MNETPPTSKRSAEMIDELLSASLDGLLDEAADDLGIPPAEAHSIVADHPDRAAALLGARDLIAAPTPLDEVTRRRLVSTALSPPSSFSAAGAPRRRRLMASAAGIAAALLLLAGIGALLSGLSGGNEADRSAGSAARGSTSETAPALGPTADFGEVSDPKVLRDQLKDVPSPLPQAAETEAEGASRSSAAYQELRGVEIAPPPGEIAGEASSTTAGALDTDAAAGSTPSAPPGDAGVDCVTLLAADFEGVGVPAVVATATFEGAPAGVLVLSDDDSLTAVVYSAADCAILATQSLTTR